MMIEVQQDGLVSQPAVIDGKTYGGTILHVSNNVPQGKQRFEFHEGYDGERRHSFPNILPKKEEQSKMKRCFSEITMKQKRKISLEDPFAKTILDCLDLLERLSRCLDKEYKYGSSKCWKHVAEHFGIEEEEYQKFKYSEIHSPTEEMFEYLKTSDPDITIGMVKDGLRSIGRQDVIKVLIKYELTDNSINNDTLVSSLFDSKPDVIGSMAFLLDRQKIGLINWIHLAGKLEIPRSVYKSFGTGNTSNPTENLFEHLNVHFPKMRVEELITHLITIRRRDVVNAIRESTKVKSGSLMKDLMGDLGVMDNVCELLNQNPQTNKVLGWKHLGNRFKIDKDTLDDLSPPQGDLECPTEALIHHLGSQQPYLRIRDFIYALHVIDRPDALAVLEDYLPDGCVPDFLQSLNGNENSQGRS